MAGIQNKKRASLELGSFGRSKSLLISTTASQIQRIREEGGVMPLDVMIYNMNAFHTESIQATAQLLELEKAREKDNKAVRRDALIELRKVVVDNRLAAQHCAVDAAPYLHSRAPRRLIVAGDADAPLQHEHAYKLVEEYKGHGDDELQLAYTAVISGEAITPPENGKVEVIPPKSKIKRAG